MRDREEVHRPTEKASGTDDPPDLKTLIEQQKQANELAALKRTAVTDRLSALGIDTAGAPEGVVEVGAKAGALAPWLAGQLWGELAREVSAGAKRALVQGAPGRVLVVTDHDLLSRDLVHREVLTALARFEKAVASAGTLLTDAGAPGTEPAPTIAPETSPDDENTGEGGEGADGAAAEAAAPVSPLSMSLDLLKLLRVDYTVAAAEVSVSSTQLADMVAGYLARTNVDVVRDELALVSTTGVVSRIQKLLEDVVVRRELLVGLERRLAAGRASTKRLTARLTELQTAWADAAAEKEPSKAGLAELDGKIKEVSKQIADESDADADDELTVTRVTDLLTVVETGCTSMLLPSADGKPSALRLAAVQEGIQRSGAATPDQAVSHVLYVESLGSHADVTTRKSMIGSSDRLHHVASSGVTWLLHSTADAKLVDGGTDNRARQLVYSLSTGATYGQSLVPWSPLALPEDPSLKTEVWLRGAIVALAVMLGIAAILLGVGTIMGITVEH